MPAVHAPPIIPPPLMMPPPLGSLRPARRLTSGLSTSRHSRTGAAMPNATRPLAAAAIPSALRRLIVGCGPRGSVLTTTLSLLAYRDYVAPTASHYSILVTCCGDELTPRRPGWADDRRRVLPPRAGLRRGGPAAAAG